MAGRAIPVASSSKDPWTAVTTAWTAWYCALYSKSGERNEDLARDFVPDDTDFEGVFAVIVRRAPGNVWDVEHTADGRIRRIRRKVPRPWVNHYAFQVVDRDWGHMILPESRPRCCVRRQGGSRPG